MELQSVNCECNTIKKIQRSRAHHFSSMQGWRPKNRERPLWCKVTHFSLVTSKNCHELPSPFVAEMTRLDAFYASSCAKLR